MDYRQLICIKNVRTNRYLSVDPQFRLLANQSHPYLKHKENANQNEIFQIVNPTSPDFSGPLIFQSTVMLYSPSLQMFLCCAQNGEIKFQTLAPTEALTSKASKLNIYSAQNTKKQLNTMDDVVFKFNDTNFMICELNYLVSWSGPNISQDSTWKVQKANCPPLPDWYYQRPNISLSYLQQQEPVQLFLTKKEERKPIGSHSSQIQSIYIIEDILYAMMGIEGNYIKKRNSSFEYAMEPHLEETTCDVSLHQLISRLIPMCSQRDQIEYLLQIKNKFENGYVAQALCSCIRELMHKFTLMVNQLDQEFIQGDLTLQKLWYYLQPSIRIIDAIHNLVTQTKNLTGGALLSKLVDILNNSTDAQVIQTLQVILEKSFVPYMKQLNQWIYYGKLDDPFEEFIIQEKKIQKSQLENDYRDNYWDSRYTLRPNQQPKFLEKYSEIILRTGKYLNVLQNPNPPFNNHMIENLDYIVKNQDFSHIMDAFVWSNEQIIQLLFEKENLIGRIRSFKSFFLFFEGDFFIHFMEAAEQELVKESKDIPKEKLESLFDLSLRNVCQNDPYKEDLTCYMEQYTTAEQIYAYLNLKGGEVIDHRPPRSSKIKGAEGFTIDAKVPWPSNLILSRASIVCYQILFRSLFNLHYIERQLHDAWLGQKQNRLSGRAQVFYKQNMLVQNFLHFIKSYLYYLSYDVIEKNYTNFEAKLKNANNFEDVRNMHTKFIDDCLNESMITDTSFIKTLNKLLTCALAFAAQIQRQQKQFLSLQYSQQKDRLSRQKGLKEEINMASSQPQFEEITNKFKKEYDTYFKEILSYDYQFQIISPGFNDKVRL
ncbi:hypothetical protein pb186bvf_000970 [Paramecium bursaria]